jgi:hypothetical protein
VVGLSALDPKAAIEGSDQSTLGTIFDPAVGSIPELTQLVANL